MDELNTLQIRKVSRTLIYVGTHFAIECAIRKDGSSPAMRMFDQLANSRVEIPDVPPPDAAQPSFLTDLMIFIKEIADGYMPRAGALNYLTEGIWELKRETIRITFYDTDGSGNFHGHQHKRFLEDQFYSILRLGHSFVKQSARTSQEDIFQALQTRKEDIDYDKGI
jgi:hypothetical protein